MNNVNESSGVANGAVPSPYRSIDGPDSASLAGHSTATPPAVDLMQRAVQGAHHSIDRLADAAAPTVQRWGESVESAEAALQQKADALREMPEVWSETVRRAVRSHPLLALAAAAGLGALIVRVAR